MKRTQWEVDIHKAGGDWTWNIRETALGKPKGRHIAEANKYLRDVESNAHLIAAAPDLLEACKEVAERLRSADIIKHRGSTNSKGDSGQQCYAASVEVDVLQQAITKAESV